jgi:cell division initiation protein
MIDLTPLEVRKKKGDFRRIMRGYDPALVDDFLDLVADRLEQLVRENMALSERTGRQDQQVAEYRERERALTEALVTAQQMREEIRKQTARETELAKRTAEQEAAQLRAAVAQETKDLRAAAQQEVAKLRAAAQRDASQIRSQVMLEREREEEAFRRLRGRQEQFLTGYRAFLERELAELSNLANVLGVAPPGGDTNAREGPGPNVFTPGTVGPGAAAAAFMSAARIDSELTAVAANSPPLATGADAELAEPPPAPLSDLDEFFPPGDDPELRDLAYAKPVEEVGDLGLSDPFLDEPFEPEPLLPDDLPPPRPTLRGQRSAGAHADATRTDARGSLSAARPDTPERSPAGSGRSAPQTAASGEPVGDTLDAEDTSLLLRNAEAAGYHMPELDDEFLFDEDLSGSASRAEDDGWLPSLLEDEEK